MSEWPTPERLDALFTAADRARIYFAGVSSGEPTNNVVRFRVDDLGALRPLLAIQEPTDGFHCMCLGSVAVELLADKRRVGMIGLHHGESIRVEGWESDARLLHGRALAEWLAAREVPELLAEMDDAAAHRDASMTAQQRWKAATPRGISEHLAGLTDFTGGPRHGLRPDELQPVIDALLAEYETPVAGCSALLRWYGAGAGPWSGYASYEGLAEVLLLHVGSELVAAALEHGDDAVALGAARYFAGWHFSQTRPEDVRLLTPDARERLLERTREMGVDDNLQRLSFAVTPRQ